MQDEYLRLKWNSLLRHNMTTPKTDDKLDFAVEVQDVPPLDSTLSEAEYADDEVDHGYLSAPKWTMMYRSVFFQMIIFGW